MTLMEAVFQIIAERGLDVDLAEIKTPQGLCYGQDFLARRGPFIDNNILFIL